RGSGPNCVRADFRSIRSCRARPPFSTPAVPHRAGCQSGPGPRARSGAGALQKPVQQASHLDVLGTRWCPVDMHAWDVLGPQGDGEVFHADRDHPDVVKDLGTPTREARTTAIAGRSLRGRAHRDPRTIAAAMRAASALDGATITPASRNVRA